MIRQSILTKDVFSPFEWILISVDASMNFSQPPQTIYRFFVMATGAEFSKTQIKIPIPQQTPVGCKEH